MEADTVIMTSETKPLQRASAAGQAWRGVCTVPVAQRILGGVKHFERCGWAFERHPGDSHSHDPAYSGAAAVPRRRGCGSQPATSAIRQSGTASVFGAAPNAITNAS